MLTFIIPLRGIPNLCEETSVYTSPQNNLCCEWRKVPSFGCIFHTNSHLPALAGIQIRRCEIFDSTLSAFLPYTNYHIKLSIVCLEAYDRLYLHSLSSPCTPSIFQKPLFPDTKAFSIHCMPHRRLLLLTA